MSNEITVEERCIRELGWSITQVATSTMADMQRELQHTVGNTPVAPTTTTIPTPPPPEREHTTEQLSAGVNRRIEKMTLVLKTGTLYPADDLFLREAIKKEKKRQAEYRAQIRTVCLGKLKSKQQVLAAFTNMAADNNGTQDGHDQVVIGRLQAEIKVHQQNLQSLE